MIPLIRETSQQLILDRSGRPETHATMPMPGVLENSMIQAIGKLATVDTALRP